MFGKPPLLPLTSPTPHLVRLEYPAKEKLLIRKCCQWHPDNDALAKLRASIDERPHRLRRVLTGAAFRRTFLPKSKEGDEKSILAAFAQANQENALKTKPKVCDIIRTRVFEM